MVSFESDYIAGAHPAILRRLTETNMESLPGYGTDRYCRSAAEKIRDACKCPEAEVEFLTGGTQTNSIVISAMLKDYQGVVAASTGHISVHEAGAIEYSGHKILELPQKDGKICAPDLRRFIEEFHEDGNCEHMVFPGMVYISYPTEYGTIYSKKELTDLYEVCREFSLPLFIDGARLGYGLASRQSDMALSDVAKLCDVFYIGGTKVGALCGEAVVFTKGNRPEHFANYVKKRGGLLAKGRLIGIQFDMLFTDDLYFDISHHAIDMSEKLKDILHDAGVPFYLESPTNQQFVIIENKMLEKLKKHIAYSFWEKYDESHTVIRLVTSWSTSEEDMILLKEAFALVNPKSIW